MTHQFVVDATPEFILYSMETDRRASYNREDWLRLRDTWSAIRAARLSLLEQSNSLEKAIAEQSNYRDYMSEIQNKEIHLKLHKNRLQLVRQRIRAVQSRLGSALKEEVKKEKEREELKTSVETMEKDIHEVSQQAQTIRLTFVTLYNELIFRRRYMIYELWRIFFLFSPIMSLLCKKQLGKINVLVTCMTQSKAFISELAIIERNTPIPSLVPLLAIYSCLMHRDTLDVYNLFPGTKQKRKSLAAFYLLQLLVVHLRTECGLATTERNRPMKNFIEVMLLCFGSKLSLSPTNGEEEFINELNPYSSASSAIFRCLSTKSLRSDSQVESFSKNRSLNYMQKKFAKGLTVNCDESNSLLSILEVVSPTWSPKKLVSEVTTVRKTSTSKKDASYSLSIHQSPSSAHSKYVPSV
uniref:Uncharacterized protein n=1 Tax=Ditylenchus dipsaci TaxID=166011 RepID=A0A915D1B2_9BILA